MSMLMLIAVFVREISWRNCGREARSEGAKAKRGGIVPLSILPCSAVLLVLLLLEGRQAQQRVCLLCKAAQQQRKQDRNRRFVDWVCTSYFPPSSRRFFDLTYGPKPTKIPKRRFTTLDDPIPERTRRPVPIGQIESNFPQLSLYSA